MPNRPNPASQEDLREEADALAREFAHDAIKWARRGLHFADRLGEAVTRTGERAMRRAEDVVERTRSSRK
jgi:hypothetical protein